MSEVILWLVLLLSILPVVLGLLIFIVVQRHRQQAAKQLSEFIGDSFVVVTQIKASEVDLAENVYIQAVNGQPVQRVLLSFGVAGYYLPVGQQVLEVAADFGVGRLDRGKLVCHNGLLLTVRVEKGYSLPLSLSCAVRATDF